MMSNEKALTIKLEQHELLSIFHEGSPDAETAVVIIVGGPQYRVGSHRQFIQLARYLASQGIPCLRFDYQGMGDSQGEKKEFDQIDKDIEAAIDALMAEKPAIKRIVLWGLCDAASASLIYGWKDDRVSGLILLNPWLKNDQAEAKTMVKHYYLKRILSGSFWKKLLSGKVDISKSTKEAKGFVQSSITAVEQPSASYQQQMLEGLNKFGGQICLILSGEDLTAKEFEQQAFAGKTWHKFNDEKCQIAPIENADHTFSSLVYKKEVEKITQQFIVTI